ncbi:terminase gpA endonuclease subunit [Phycisphaerales bacterium AB-hyl4]|uniref:Terminase gpA endonuclease subunit n=1 Tax=Natronomicrosphaera hydrolytica TaxID=3242702 RepID=A0ABV4U4I7_9BACT
MAKRKKANSKKKASDSPPEPPPTNSSYERHRERSAGRQAEQSRAGRDIGELPPIENPKRREAAGGDFKLFCQTYAPHVFCLAWADPHDQAAERGEAVVRRGGLFALAMPRGWGKTSLCMWAVLFAVLYGLRRFPVYVGAAGDEARLRLEEIKVELETNDLLLADFPEVCFPIRALEGIVQRGKGQTCQGKRTHIGWKGRRIVLPTIAGSPASGAVIESRGITGAIRGMRHTTPDGQVLRPDLAVVDDPQDDESAESPSQVAKRLRTINGSILGLAGPTRRIAAFLPCTVIQPGDLADQVLNRQLNPHWNGQRTQALSKLPSDDKLWAEYAEVRAAGYREGDDGAAGNAFYLEHREKLELGAEVVWPANVKEGDVAALQSLMNLKIDDERSFWAEQQQQPMSLEQASEDKLDADAIAAKIIGVKRDVAPNELTRLVSFIDPSSKLLWWIVCAFGDGFAGHVMAYGAWPDQGLPYFTKSDAKKTLARAKPGAGRPAQVLHALENLSEQLLAREWQNESGQPLRIEKCLVDANWGEATTLIYQFCRQSPHASILTPSHGRYLGPGDAPIGDWKKQPGDRIGHHWRERPSKNHAKRFVTYDTNRWKTAVADGLRVPRGDVGGITLYQASRERHRLVIDHLLSESPVPVESKGTQLTIWKQPPNKDNDLLDGLVGCCVGASMLGIEAVGHKPAPKKKSRRRRGVSYL